MKDLTAKWTEKSCEERQQKLRKAWCWSTTCRIVQILSYVQTPLGSLNGNRQGKQLKVAVACPVSYVAFSTDQTIWLWHKWTFFVESYQNQSLQGNPNTSKQTSCIYSLEVRRQSKGLKQQTGAFFPIACFQCSLKAFLKSLESVLCSWLEGTGMFSPATVTVEFLESHERHNMA